MKQKSFRKFKITKKPLKKQSIYDDDNDNDDENDYLFFVALLLLLLFKLYLELYIQLKK